MAHMSSTADTFHMDAHGDTARVVRRTIVIGLVAFLTVVDLFATQAILPSLTQAYQVTPAAMSFAVNASTMGMAVAGRASRASLEPERELPAQRHAVKDYFPICTKIAKPVT